MIKEKIIVPKRLKMGIMPNEKGISNHINIIACDTETTKHGKPYLLIMKNEDDLQIIDTENIDILDVWTDYIYDHIYPDKYSKKDSKIKYSLNVLMCHNLLFDLSAILHKHHEAFKNPEFYIRGETDRYKYIIEVKNYNTTFGRIYFFKSKMNFGNKETKYRKRNVTRQCMLLDSFAFYKSSLEKIAKDLQLQYNKAETLPFIGDIHNGLSDFTNHDINNINKELLLHYAEMDGHTQYELAKHIIDIHNQFDVRICVSLPQLAARIFRHRFMKEDDLLTFPNPYDNQHMCELSYHGGKNGFYLEKPQIIKDVYEVDVNSMYPYAMNNIPNFNHAEYEFIDYFDDDKEGVYCISGFVEDNKYGIIPKHEFTGENYYKDTYVDNTCVTSYELRKALDMGLLSLDSCHGYIVEEKEKHNPFKSYVDFFYNKKSNASDDDVYRSFYKLSLNSLYGKTIQTVEVCPIESPFIVKPRLITFVNENLECETPRYFEAGGLYNPMIATLITGFARTYLFDLENKYMALDSSTDSIKTKIEPKTNKKLGGLSIKNYGDCLFIRNKFYVHFGDTITYAKHGCQASLKDILKMYIEGKNTYEYKRMIKVKESLIRKDVKPLTMPKMKATLNVDW